jgi:hypothetical protein
MSWPTEMIPSLMTRNPCRRRLSAASAGFERRFADVVHELSDFRPRLHAGVISLLIESRCFSKSYSYFVWTSLARSAKPRRCSSVTVCSWFMIPAPLWRSGSDPSPVARDVAAESEGGASRGERRGAGCAGCAMRSPSRVQRIALGWGRKIRVDTHQRRRLFSRRFRVWLAMGGSDGCNAPWPWLSRVSNSLALDS